MQPSSSRYPPVLPVDGYPPFSACIRPALRVVFPSSDSTKGWFFLDPVSPTRYFSPIQATSSLKCKYKWAKKSIKMD